MKSKYVIYFLSNVWSDSTGIQLILCDHLSQWMRHWSTTTHQKWNSSQNNARNPVVQSQRKQNRSHLPERTWTACFSTWKGFYKLIILKKIRKTTDEYYSNFIDKLDAKIQEKRPGLKKKKIHLTTGQRTCIQRYVEDGKTAGCEVCLPHTHLFFPDLPFSFFILHLFPN
ncbi:hypothetical protein TNIN_256721 [Trichonephila inaurata madagascariensis]|uniref:Uncharacterized protein n=1 Tax=Trichonephila inaurata madagascariensis TaxID=2747483 RepID=A0A8X6MH94_9ARAC|nr:hypothetical protein TNIN_256721 [Trichonephila inaurata madagascariensis]